MLQISLLFAVLLILVSIAIMYAQYSKNIYLQNLAQKQIKLNKNLDIQKGKMSSDQERASLTQEIAKLEELHSIREKMFVVLNKIQYQVQPGFSGCFNALMQYTIDGIWFTTIQFKDGGDVIMLEGKTTEAENLPKLLQNLGKATVFNGKKFDVLDVYVNEKDKDLFTFVVKTNI
jgi:Tfp pilus assembly protein PilN